MRFSINQKIMLGFTIVIVLLSILPFQFFFNQLDRVIQQSQIVTTSIVSNQESIYRFERMISGVQSDLLLVRADRDFSRLPNLRNRLLQLQTQLIGWRTTLDVPEIALLSLQRMLEQNSERLTALIALVESNDIQAGNAQVTSELATIIDGLDATAEFPIIIEYNNNRIHEQQRNIDGLWQSALSTFLIILAGTVVLAVLFGITIARSISRQIRATSDQIQSISTRLVQTTEREYALSEKQAEKIKAASTTLEGLTSSSRIITDETRRMTRQAGETADRIHHLGQLSQEVEQVNAVVVEIAQKINILSLNASIEASRAGEQGKGFSAVALEIRKLAENTQNSTSGIRVLVKSILEGAQFAKDAIEEMVAIVGTITGQIQQQDTGTAQISETVGIIDEGMKLSVEGTQNTSRTAGELDVLAQNLQQMI